MSDTESDNLIVYNGEVYNFPQLRQELESKGERFVSRTDTEVVLKLYRLEGVKCLERLRGMFAFAIWDARRGELFLARDRVGKKPLYYHVSNQGSFLFASEVRALLASDLIRRDLEVKALESFLANGFVISPFTLVREVKSLLPGRWMRVSREGSILSTGCYWSPPHVNPAETHTTGYLVESSQEKFREAVSSRMRSDVPVGIFLSGGMDSSAILGALGDDHNDIHTFSITFPGSALDEGKYSRRVAQYWKSTHTEVAVGEQEFASWLPGALAAMDQPTFDGINTFFVSKAARESGLKVALSGLGADELFGGYPSFRAVPLMRMSRPIVPRIPKWISRRIRTLLAQGHASVRVSNFWKVSQLLCLSTVGRSRSQRFPISFYQVAQMLFPAGARHALLPDVSAVNAIEDPWLQFGIPEEYARFLECELDGSCGNEAFSLLAWRLFLGERCLRDVDAMSMSLSLEVRAPFTDHILVESIFRIPANARCVSPPDKPFEQRLLGDYLEGAWQERGKQGFVMPFTEWLAGPQSSRLVEETLHDSELLRNIGLDALEVDRLWRRHLATPGRMPWSRVWAVFVLATWCRRTGVRL